LCQEIDGIQNQTVSFCSLYEKCHIYRLPSFMYNVFEVEVRTQLACLQNNTIYNKTFLVYNVFEVEARTQSVCLQKNKFTTKVFCCTIKNETVIGGLWEPPPSEMNLKGARVWTGVG